MTPIYAYASIAMTDWNDKTHANDNHATNGMMQYDAVK
jgi:hypothetical protein